MATIWRWVRKGKKTPDGSTTYLRAGRLGGRWVTSLEALQEFMDALTPAPPAAGGTAAPAPTPGQRRRAAERAGEELRRRGC